MTEETPAGILAGRVALISGAARGQGRCHAVRLASQGADVIAVDSCAPLSTIDYPLPGPTDLDDTARLVEAAGGRVLTSIVDVRDPDALVAAVDRGVSTFGRLDVVVANAGVVSYSPARHLRRDAWTELMDINVNGVWWTISAALPHLSVRGGSIIITSSTAGLRAMQNCVHYVTSKHAVVGMMRALAVELGPLNIRVNTVHPGTVNSPMTQNEATYRLFLPGREAPQRDDFERIAAKLNVLPVPLVEPDDVSDLVVFLASDAARTITGAALPVDAGLAAHW